VVNVRGVDLGKLGEISQQSRNTSEHTIDEGIALIRAELGQRKSQVRFRNAPQFGNNAVEYFCAYACESIRGPAGQYTHDSETARSQCIFHAKFKRAVGFWQACGG
jgi:hypothetical protein